MTAKPLIRIVDDDEALTASSAMLLEAMGWDVAVWHSGGAFLDEADLMRPGCLVLDVRMPGLTGLDVQAELERRGSNLPILFLSAHGSIQMAVHVMRHGAVDWACIRPGNSSRWPTRPASFRPRRLQPKVPMRRHSKRFFDLSHASPYAPLIAPANRPLGCGGRHWLRSG